jgi:hypothetical protein
MANSDCVQEHCLNFRTLEGHFMMTDTPLIPMLEFSLLDTDTCQFLGKLMATHPDQSMDHWTDQDMHPDHV